MPFVACTIAASAPAFAVDIPIHLDGFEDGGTRDWTTTVPPTCTDGNQSGDETGEDCGGAFCAPCTPPCAPRGFGEIGGPCAGDDDCFAVGSFCYVGSYDTQNGAVVFAPEGYCGPAFFSGNTCDGDADCPEGSICALDALNFFNCMPECVCSEGFAPCPAHQACQFSFDGFTVLDRAACTPGNADAADGDACEGFYECNELSSCLDDVEYPNGECERFECTVGDDASCHGGHCILSDPGFSYASTCIDLCSGDVDCRTDEGYRCFDPDGVGTAPNYCRHPHVGDACGIAAECGGGSWVCQTGAAFPGGYCTLTGCPTPGSTAGCSRGSVCADNPLSPVNYCADRCEGGGQGSCRAGYLCLDTDPSAGIVLGCTSI